MTDWPEDLESQMTQCADRSLENVQLATRYIWASFFVSIFGLTIFLEYHPVILQYFMRSNGTDVILSIIATIAILIILAMMIYFVVTQILKGKNWARVTFMVFVLYDIASCVFDFYTQREVWIFSFINRGIVFGFQLYACYLIFTSPGKDWFKSEEEDLDHPSY